MESILIKVIYITGGITIIFTLIPLIRHDLWVFRVFEYPRLQKFIISLMVFMASLFILDFSELLNQVFGLALLTNCIFLGIQIYPFTPIAPRQLKSASEGSYDVKNVMKLMVGNVYQYNRKSQKLTEIIKQIDPDILLLVETDQWWLDNLRPATDKYPYKAVKPLDNTYGMLFYSRFQLEDTRLKFLVEDDKPSIDTKIILPSGQKVRLFGIHPAPPAPQHNPTTTERDKELIMVGKMAKKETLPVIVTGDLNDVAWSYTTRLFNNISGLLDPRRGRGMFNTFHAKYPFFRWPLDHIFCCPEFELLRLKKLPAFGSDHFPLFIELKLTENSHVHEIPEASEEDHELAQEKLDAI